MMYSLTEKEFRRYDYMQVKIKDLQPGLARLDISASR